MERTDIAREFKQREPWVTKFVVDGEAYGGRFDAMEDARIAKFSAMFSEARKIYWRTTDSRRSAYSQQSQAPSRPGGQLGCPQIARTRNVRITFPVRTIIR